MDDLKFIKKHYGEKLMQVCRELFPTILEEEGVLSQIISSKFAVTRSLGDDVQDYKTEFKDFIYDEYYKLIEKKEKEQSPQVIQSPYELMNSAGYILFPECKTEADVQSFRHYYKRDDGRVITKYDSGSIPEQYNGEEICTFNGGRLDDCRVWFAVRKDVDTIKREDYPLPKDSGFAAKKDEYAFGLGKDKWEDLTPAQQKRVLRDGIYGTSVISIQISKKGKPTISIKNRYNHRLPKGTNPDATYGNNLDNIVKGLTGSFAEAFGIDFSQIQTSQIDLPQYVLANNGKMYRYNVERNGVYFCENNVIVDNGNVFEYDKDTFIVTDTGDVFGLFARSIFQYKRNGYMDGVTHCDSVTVNQNKDGSRIVSFIYNGTERMKFTLDEHNCVVGLTDRYTTSLPDSFFKKYSNLRHLDFPNLVRIEEHTYNEEAENLITFRAESLKYMCAEAMQHASKLIEFYAPSLTHMERANLMYAKNLKEFNAPELTFFGAGSLAYAKSLTSFSAPKITSMSDSLVKAGSLTNFDAPQVKSMWSCLRSVESLVDFYAPNLTTLDNSFINTDSLKRFYAPNLVRRKTLNLPYTQLDEFVVSPELAERLNMPIKTMNVADEPNHVTDNVSEGEVLSISSGTVIPSLTKSEEESSPSLAEGIERHILARESTNIETGFANDSKSQETLIVPESEDFGPSA